MQGQLYLLVEAVTKTEHGRLAPGLPAGAVPRAWAARANPPWQAPASSQHVTAAAGGPANGGRWGGPGGSGMHDSAPEILPLRPPTLSGYRAPAEVFPTDGDQLNSLPGDGSAAGRPSTASGSAGGGRPCPASRCAGGHPFPFLLLQLQLLLPSTCQHKGGCCRALATPARSRDKGRRGEDAPVAWGTESRGFLGGGGRSFDHRRDKDEG